MTTRVQTLRSSTAGVRPANNTRQPGELYVNWAENQLGVINSTRAPVDLLPVTYFSSTSSYTIGDYIWHNGLIYRAIANVAPGAFSSAQWVSINDAGGGTVAAYLPLTGGVLTGDLFIAEPTGNSSLGINKAASGADAQIVGQTANKVRWDMTLGDSTAESGGNAGSNFSINAFADNGSTLVSTPIFIERKTGYVTVNQALTVNGNIENTSGIVTVSSASTDAGVDAVATQNRTAYFAGHKGPLASPSVRWIMALGDNSAETGANVGSDFSLNAFADDGATPTHTPIYASRKTGLMLLSGDPVSPLGIATKQYVDAHAGGSGGPFLPVIGGTLSGPIVLASDPTAALGAATKQYVDAHGSGAFLPLSGGTLTGALVPNQTAGITGTTTNNNVNAGGIGEYLIVSQTNNVSLSSAVSKNITQITLPAGDWDVDATILINFSTSGTNAGAVLTTTSGVIPNTITPGWVEIDGANIFGYTGPLGTARFSFSTPTPVYLVAESGFGSGTCLAQGIIRARRVR